MTINRKEYEIGKLGVALCLLGLIGFAIAGYFRVPQLVQKHTVSPVPTNNVNNIAEGAKAHKIGPIVIDKPYTTYEIETKTTLAANTWTFVEVVVEDRFGEYLYSFGQELWHETGRDSDGPWRETRHNFESNLTFPEAGEFYLSFMVSSKNNRHPSKLYVKLIKRNGSAVLHFWMGVLLLIAGLICIEIQYGIFQKTLEAAMKYDD